MTADRLRIAIIMTGGTIDSVGVDRLDLAWYLDAGAWLEDGELVSRVRVLAAIADVEPVRFRRIRGRAVTDADPFDLIARIHQILKSGRVEGIAITHGKNTLEETAYDLHLTRKTDRPVVIVGSMRSSSALTADGYLNDTIYSARGSSAAARSPRTTSSHGRRASSCAWPWPQPQTRTRSSGSSIRTEARMTALTA